MSSSSDALRNRSVWDRKSDDYQQRNAAFIGGSEPRWGMWQLPESELDVLGDVAGKDVLELGCGAAQWAVLLAQRGARMVGLDNSERQLEHARELMAEGGVDFPLIHSGAEQVPLPDASFDVVFCDHGAMTFADPYLTVPEVARLLRPGGLFAFSHSTPFVMVCWNPENETMERRLVGTYFGMHRFDELADEPVEFNLPYGEWIRLFRANGFRVEELLEIRPPEGAESTYRTAEETEWARSWPMEEIWKCVSGSRPVACDRALPGRAAGKRQLTEHAARNQESWAREAENYVAGAERNWAASEIAWGIVKAPESEVGLLGDVAGRDVVELGCGTAYVSAWLARRGARVVGVEVTEEQLATARRMQREHGFEFPLVHASAEDVPLPDESFDLAVSEYGASIWCDPDLWIAEAARLLRPGGELVFLVNGTLLMLCSPDADPVEPAGTELLRPYFGMRRFEWMEDTSVDFHLGYGDWIRVLTWHGFEVEALVELQGRGLDSGRYNLFTAEWAERWPAEEMWKARKTG
jgi:ubiquinone/menaquinone biosynthesis C-methylase UbiE